MLIFNCTEAASKFFSRVYKGKTITPVEAQPPSPTPEEDEWGDSAEQWLVHAITVQRKHVLFVIHIKPRYWMIFADAKKADVEGFIHRFTERWIYGLMIGALIVLIRVVNPAYPESVMLVILFMNVVAPFIDYLLVQANLKRSARRRAST